MDALDTDSTKTRNLWYEKLQSFLQHTGIDNTKNSLKEKAHRMKQIDYTTFMDILSTINGILIGKDKFQRWKEDISKTIVGIPGDEVLEPPEEANKEFEKLFNAMKDNISAENIKKYAAKIYAGIIFAHIFTDGNWRTARNIYTLMTSNKNPDKNISMTRGRTWGFCEELSVYAIMACYRNHGIEIDSYEKDSRYKMGNVGIPRYWSMTHLKWLAAKEIMYKEWVNIDNSFELDQLHVKQNTAYQKVYQNIRQERYREIQKIIDQFTDRAIEELDKAIGPTE